MSCGCNSKTISNLDVARLYPMEPRPKWADKSTTSYDILDFKSYIKDLQRKYLVIERHMFKIQGILL